MKTFLFLSFPSLFYFSFLHLWWSWHTLCTDFPCLQQSGEQSFLCPVLRRKKVSTHTSSVESLAGLQILVHTFSDSDANTQQLSYVKQHFALFRSAPGLSQVLYAILHPTGYLSPSVFGFLVVLPFHAAVLVPLLGGNFYQDRPCPFPQPGALTQLRMSYTDFLREWDKIGGKIFIPDNLSLLVANQWPGCILKFSSWGHTA